MARRSTLASLIFGVVCLGIGIVPTSADDTPLEGEVQKFHELPDVNALSVPVEPMPVPVVGRRQSASDSEHGRVSASASRPFGRDVKLGLEPLNGTPDSRAPVLQGEASKNAFGLSASAGDPDAGNQELMIAWDRWRNRLLHAIQSGMQETLNNPSPANLRWDPVRQAMVSSYPLGTTAWFSCQVTPDQRITHIELLHSSGHPHYDRAVLDAIDALQGSAILRYPPGSRRKIVTQVAGIRTAQQAEYRNFHFGDVERYWVPKAASY